MSAGGSHTCALHVSKRIRCWGSDTFGQSGAPSGRYRALSGKYESVSAGWWHTCAVRVSGEVACWGARIPDYDDLVVSYLFPYATPLGDFTPADPPSGTFRSVSAGAAHTCGVRDSGELACWGAEETAPAGRYTWVSAGWNHTCAVRDSGEVVCWGDNSHGQTDVPE